MSKKDKEIKQRLRIMVDALLVGGELPFHVMHLSYPPSAASVVVVIPREGELNLRTEVDLYAIHCNLNGVVVTAYAGCCTFETEGEMLVVSLPHGLRDRLERRMP